MFETTYPASKADLLARIAESRAVLERVLAPLTPVQMTGLHDPAGWSVRDHLMHLAVWERSLVALLNRQPRHEVMGIDEETYYDEDIDRRNAVLYALYKDVPLTEALEAFRASHQAVLETLGQLSEAALLTLTYSAYQPAMRWEDDGTPIVAWVLGNTCEHYDEHRVVIEQILATGTG
ncbi:MAG: ClbS/DfsB family four-helix bundle protein [Anaerolineae bacterium]|nr:ClbS/DfsB family four-helix bundle protein [Anaerolineae bacterium]